MNWRAIRAIIRKDLKVVVQSKSVLIPLIVVPLVLLVLLPGIGGVLLAQADDTLTEEMTDDLQPFYDNLPASIADEINSYESEAARVAAVAFKYFFAPFFLILPIMLANVIAADSFVGEKERKTLEALIYTPTSDRELYIAKLLSPWVAAIVLSVVGFVVYVLVVNLTTWPLFDGPLLPNLSWLLLLVWVSPAAAGFGLGAMVLVSSRVNTFQEAYQLGGMVVLPVVLLILGQAGGVLYFSPVVVFFLGLVLWLIDAGVFWYGSQTFERGELISRL